MLPHMARLEPADTGSDLDIDVLVGSDLYWRAVFMAQQSEDYILLGTTRINLMWHLRPSM